MCENYLLLGNGNYVVALAIQTFGCTFEQMAEQYTLTDKHMGTPAIYLYEGIIAEMCLMESTLPPTEVPKTG